jgi:hypothetical protein
MIKNLLKRIKKIFIKNKNDDFLYNLGIDEFIYRFDVRKFYEKQTKEYDRIYKIKQRSNKIKKYQKV